MVWITTESFSSCVKSVFFTPQEDSSSAAIDWRDSTEWTVPTPLLHVACKNKRSFFTKSQRLFQQKSWAFKTHTEKMSNNKCSLLVTSYILNIELRIETAWGPRGEAQSLEVWLLGGCRSVLMVLPPAIVFCRATRTGGMLTFKSNVGRKDRCQDVLLMCSYSHV